MDATSVFIIMALFPLAVLGILRVLGEQRGAALWWLAVAFSTSWFADVVAEQMPIGDRWTIVLVFPVVQATLVGAVLLLRLRSKVALLAVLTLASLVSIAWRGVRTPEVLILPVSGALVATIAWRLVELPRLLRSALVTYFGGGTIAWILHVAWINVPVTMWIYQCALLIGLLLFCLAAINPRPSLRVEPV